MRRCESYSLTSMQEGMVFSSLANEGGGFDIEQLTWKMRGEVDPESLRTAFGNLGRRHPVLRTAFRWQGLGAPVQDVYEDVLLPFEFRDLSQHPPILAEATLQEFLAADRSQGFNLAEPPLTRLALFRLQRREHVLVWTFHHAIVDGRSMTLLSNELLQIYSSQASGTQLDPAIPRPFKEFVEWQSAHLSQNREAAEAYWRGALEGFPAPTPLPGMNSGSPLAEPFSVASCERLVSPGTTAALRKLAERCQVTLNTMVQAAWALVLSKHASRDEVMFGVTRACRHSTVEGSESMVGMFINTVPMRIAIPDDLPVREWLAGIRARHVEMRPFEQTPLHEIRSWAGLNAAERMFGSLLVFENYQPQDVLDGLIGGSPIEVQMLEKTNFPLTLAAYAGKRLRLCLEYHHRHCGDIAATRILCQVETVLEGLTAFPDGRVGDIPCLPAEELKTVVETWNQTDDASYDVDVPVHRLFESQAARVPHRIAVEDGARRTTYAALNESADRIAAQLRIKGVKPEQLVGLFVDRSTPAIEGMLGIMKAGCAYLPLDVSYPADRLAFMIENSRVQVVLSTTALAPTLPASRAEVFLLDRFRQDAGTPGQPVHVGAAANLAYVIYTSGSTGEPKGVMIGHPSLANYIHATKKYYGMAENDRYLQFAPLSFDASVEEIFLPLCCGATVVLRSEPMIGTVRRFLNACDEMAITVLDLPTSYWHQLVAAMDEGGLRWPTSVRLVAVGGDRMSPQRVVQWRRLVGPEVRLINFYGPTETTVGATACDLSHVDFAPSPGREISIGRPLRNLRAYVLDEKQRPAPIGAVGELYIGGRGVGRGYLHHPELTAERFLPDPFRPEGDGRMYRTGDLARWSEGGELEFAGRVDTQLKIRGYRIEPQEIEGVLARHPDVQEVVVIAREERRGGKSLIAYVVPNARSSRNHVRSRLHEWVKGRLPEFMIPSAVVLVDGFKYTAAGKIDRAALPTPSGTDAQAPYSMVPARDLLERQLVGVWEKVLKISPIGVTDSFFDLGGDSLVAIYLLTEVERLTGRLLPMVTLFEAPTIMHLANLLRKEGWEPHWKSLVPIQPSGSRKPFYCVHGVGGNILEFKDLANHMDPDQPLFGIQARGLDGKSPRLDRVEDMAASYVEEILEFQPEGPYFVGGSSFGGMIAYEISQQLRERGHKVGALVLFDTLAPDYPRYLPATTALKRKVNWWRYRIELHLSNIMVANWEGKYEYIRQKQERLLIRERMHVRRALSGFSRRVKEFFLPRVYGEVKRAAVIAEAAYIPESIGGTVVLLRATNQPYGIYEDATNGWGKFVTGELKVFHIPGHHGAIMREPRVQVLARVLSQCLRDAQAGTTT